MSSRAELKRALAESAPVSADALFRLALAALDAGLEHEVRARLALAISPDCRDPRLWQALGLAHRALHDAGEAHVAFGRAAKLAPADPLIAHSLARTALEAGYAATALFERARRLAPADAGVLLGRAAAQLAEGDGGGALQALDQVLAASPGWIDGHLTFARLQAMLDPLADPRRTLHAALARFPADSALWFALLRSHTGSGDHAGALALLPGARARLGKRPELALAEAIGLSETGEADRAQARFERLAPPASGDDAIWSIRNLIRLRRLDAAARLAERQFAGAGSGAGAGTGDASLWPYRGLLWRALGDPRWEWLEGDPRLIGSYDLGQAAGDLETLARCLRKLHVAAAAMPEQSVRGGTQTDGMLFARAEPEIWRLREALRQAIGEHVAQLPAPDPHHPTLAPPRAPLRFAGAWSVRLASGGRHADHVHAQGWLSSAFYVALPPGPEQGVLTFGESLELIPELPAFRTLPPELGRLVLFPATTWHGTRAFTAGERLTVAFDVAAPRGEP